jgi:hypothetical protein
MASDRPGSGVRHLEQEVVRETLRQQPIPGLRRAQPLDAIEAMERHLAEMRRAAEQPEPNVELSSRDLNRIKVHSSFCAAIEALQLINWSRNRIAAVLEVDPVTLKGWIENGFRQRDQLPGWVIPALTQFPDCAWRAFLRESQRWSVGSAVRAEAG